jgi:hypothetical protein
MKFNEMMLANGHDHGLRSMNNADMQTCKNKKTSFAERAASCQYPYDANRYYFQSNSELYRKADMCCAITFFPAD